MLATTAGRPSGVYVGATLVDDGDVAPTPSSSIEAHTRAFQRRFVLAVTAFAIAAIGVALVVTLAFAAIRDLAPVFVVGLVVVGGCHALARAGQVERATYALLAVAVVTVTMGSAIVPMPTSISGSIVGFMVMGALAAFLIDLRGLLIYALAATVGAGLVTARVLLAEALAPDLAWPAVLSGLVMFYLSLATLRLFKRHNRESLDLLQARMDDIDRVMVSARRIADGDLAIDVEGDSEVSETIRRMLKGLRRMVLEIRRNVADLTAAATEIAAMARSQQEGSVAQASAADEVNATLAALRKASAGVSQIADEVHEAIEATENSSQTAAVRLGELAGQARRIDEIAEMIREIASKSEVLALNAALEGVRAGERGRGFSLVAEEMQGLAERVTRSVADVQKLTRDIDDASKGTVEATQQGAARAASATASSRRIRAVAHQQQESVGQAAAAMAEVAQAAASTSASSRQTLEATNGLARLAGTLESLVAEFELGDE